MVSMTNFCTPTNPFLHTPNPVARVRGLCSCCPRLQPPGTPPGTKDTYPCNLSRVDFFLNCITAWPDPPLPRQISRAAPTLCPSPWHVIEPQGDGSWRLRPDSRAMQLWFDRHLAPPYGMRTWLRQLRGRWLPSPHKIACLPVWREDIR